MAGKRPPACRPLLPVIADLRSAAAGGRAGEDQAAACAVLRRRGCVRPPVPCRGCRGSPGAGPCRPLYRAHFECSGVGGPSAGGTRKERKVVAVEDPSHSCSGVAACEVYIGHPCWAFRAAKASQFVSSFLHRVRRWHLEVAVSGVLAQDGSPLCKSSPTRRPPYELRVRWLRLPIASPNDPPVATFCRDRQVASLDTRTAAARRTTQPRVSQP